MLLAHSESKRAWKWLIGHKCKWLEQQMLRCTELLLLSGAIRFATLTLNAAWACEFGCVGFPRWRTPPRKFPR